MIKYVVSHLHFFNYYVPFVFKYFFSYYLTFFLYFGMGIIHLCNVFCWKNEKANTNKKSVMHLGVKRVCFLSELSGGVCRGFRIQALSAGCQHLPDEV